MTRRRWIADEVQDDTAALVGEHAAHLSRVLRVQVGQQFDVACGEVVRRGTVSSVADDRVEFTLGEDLSAQAFTSITLLLAVFKFDRMEWAIEKCTELNVTSIIPVITHRTEKHLAQAAEKRIERWRRIAREAAQQSRRTSAPDIGDARKLADALGVQAEIRIVLAESEAEVQFIDALRSQLEAKSLALAIGPEGGWTPEELQMFVTAGWQAASLGLTILRAETAAIAALAIARSEFD
jgi:16S rRNA (uracil1498-N3)-methyltransferase